MADSHSTAAHSPDVAIHQDHGHDEHHQPWYRKYLFSTDHKVIGIQYGITALLFLIIGFILIAVMRWPIAYGAEKPLPFEFLQTFFAGGKDTIAAVDYNVFGAMHGTIMIFLAVVPLGFAAFGNYFLPLQIGAPDMAFPRLNMWSFWVQFVGACIFAVSFFVPGGAAKSGWTSYTPLAGIQDHPRFTPALIDYWGIDKAHYEETGKEVPRGWLVSNKEERTEKLGSEPSAYLMVEEEIVRDDGMVTITYPKVHNLGYVMNGQSMWLIGLVMLITASLLGSINIITTVIQLRAPGMTWFRMPYFCWSIFVTAFILLLAFPPLEAAGIMQLMDRVAGTNFFMPSGLVVNEWSGGIQNVWAGGGSPLLYQHLFWFLGHPEVYVLLLPAVGIAVEIIACHTRKPIWGYKSMVIATLVLGFLSFIVWAHHMYLTGMGSMVSAFFTTTTMIISIPSIILLTCMMVSLWGGSIRFPTAMLFTLAFVLSFGIGGLTGLPLGFNATDIALHDTYYVIGHFHYMVAPGILFGLIAGLYHYYPKITGRFMSEFWGKVHFWPSFILMNCTFFPMLIQGFAGMHRRMYDGGATYEGLLSQPVGSIFGLEYSPLDLNVFISWSVWLMGIAQIPFAINFIASIWLGKKVESDNPWHATTLEWQTPTPPPHGNFTQPIVVYRECYEYSVPGADKDYTPQNEPPERMQPVPEPEREETGTGATVHSYAR